MAVLANHTQCNVYILGGCKNITAFCRVFRMVSFYTYDKQGRQLWVIGPGTVNGDIFEVAFELTDGAIYGDAFDPLMVNRYPWGTGKFTFTSCYAGTAEIIPNEDFSDEFEAQTIFVSRLTPPDNCSDG